ncbi:MAG: sulfatase [Planctomycetota bacterium]
MADFFKASFGLMWRLERAVLVAAGLICGVHACASAADPPAGETGGRVPLPNIVVILIDDMGYSDIGPFGGDPKLTPNLNRMAREGRRFTNFYVSQAVCSASRASLLTGCYNVRIGILGALGPATEIGISDNEMTLAEVCRQKGYSTACFGKWHLGHHHEFLPQQHGFDEYFGLPFSNDMWPFHPEVMHLPMDERLKRWPHLPLISGSTVIDEQVTADEQALLTTQYTEHATSFIDRHADQPFFLYVPHSMVHVPLFVSEKHKDATGSGLYADVVREVDWSVGQILEALRRNQLDEKTLVIFTSDNGPWLSYGNHAGSAKPLREGKGTMFDGGCRVPCLMRWPGQIPADSECTEPAMTIDVLPTVADLIGAKLPDHPIDGKSIWPLMNATPGAKSPQEAYYFYWGRELQAIRRGNWKLHFPHEYRTLNGRPGGTDGIPAKYDVATLESALFDLETDPGESSNVVREHPDVVAELKRLAEKARAELGDRERQGAGVRSVGKLTREAPGEQ